MAENRAASQVTDLTPEAFFLQNLPWIDRVAVVVCRKFGLSGADVEDFSAWVKIKLMENNFSELRKYTGESDARTFIAMVITRYGAVFSRQRRGLWRPSRVAERFGPPAQELEMLVRRDGYTVAQAGEKLRSAGQTTLSDIELARLLATLPERSPLRPLEVAAEPALQDVVSPAYADENVVAAEETAQHRRVTEALEQAMDQLSVEDRAIALMHFVDGYSIAHVARTLQREQKPLYRRIPRIREQLREYLEAEGVSAAELQAMLDTEKL